MAHITRYDPFAELEALQKQFFGNDWAGAHSDSLQLPATDIYTVDDKQLVVEAHLPHFEEKDVQVNIDNGVLEIQAEKHEKFEDKDKKYVMRESSSSFYRRIRLPERVEADKAAAHLEHGVLKVMVPLKALPDSKKIPIAIRASSKTN